MQIEQKSTMRVFLGNDTKRAREALASAIAEEKARNPNCFVAVFDDVSFDRLGLSESLMNASLFGERNIVVIEGILDHEEGEEFYASLKNLKLTENLVLIRETELKKDLRVQLGKTGEIIEFNLKKNTEKTRDFAIADAVASKNKRLAWAEFAKTARDGAAMEEVHGRVFWAIKTLYLCKTQTKDDAIKIGVKEFTYRNYEPKSKLFLKDELEEKLSDLKEMYHSAHGGEGDLALSLEQFLLKL